MAVIRCPECGSRLTTNECPMCMKKVPFPGLRKASKKEEVWQSRKYESPYQEDHTCIRFDEGKKTSTKKKTGTQTVVGTLGSRTRNKSQTQKNKKQVTAVAIVVAVISLMSSLSSLFDAVSVKTPEPEPDIEYDAFVQAGEADAQELPSIIPGEIYNANGIVITADSSGSYYDDYAIAVTAVNNTDQNVTISTNMLSVNSYMMPSAGGYIEVEAGDTVQDYLRLYSYDLEAAGIEQVAEVTFSLDIYDSDEYTDIDQTDLITLETDIADSFEQPVDDGGWVLYNEGDVRIILRGVELSSYGDCTLELFMENTSDRLVYISDDGILINAQESSGMLWSTLRPNTRIIDSVYFYEMEELGIDDVAQLEEVSIDLRIEYMEDWLVDETVSTTVVFFPAELI